MIACFFDMELTEFDYLEETLKSYIDDNQYVIAHEQKNSKGEDKPHFHLIFEGTDTIYNNFSKVIVEKYKLRRKGRGGVIKYGKVKEIRNLERMLIYTLKDNNFRSNMEPKMLQAYFDKSFKKALKDKTLDNIVEHLDGLIQHESPNSIIHSHADCMDFRLNSSLRIVDYLVENEIKYNRSDPENYTFKYLQYSNILDKCNKKKLLKSYFTH